jgi:Protein of unknown function (DUF2384)
MNDPGWTIAAVTLGLLAVIAAYVLTKPSRFVECANAVRKLLRDTYDEAGIEIWLRSPNRNLGRRSPWELIAAGEYDRVLAEARRVGGEG